MTRALTGPARISYYWGCLAPMSIDIELRPGDNGVSALIKVTNLGREEPPALHAVDAAEAAALVKRIAGVERGPRDRPGSTGAGDVALSAELDGADVSRSFAAVESHEEPAESIAAFVRAVAPELFPEPAPPGPTLSAPPEPMFTTRELIKMIAMGLPALALIGWLIYVLVTS